MKKTYEFKPLCLLIIIFDLLLSVSMWRLTAMVSDFFSLMSSISDFINVFIFYMTGILGIIVVTVFLYIYYLKQEKIQGVLWDAILHTIFSVFFIFQLFNAKNVIQGMNMSQLTTIMGLFVFISALLHIFVMVRLDGLVQVSILDSYLPAGKNEREKMPTDNDESLFNEANEVFEKTKVNKEKIMAFLKSKNGKMAIGVVGVIIVLFTGYKIWDTFFNKTVIDVFDGMEITYAGYNGEGYANIENYHIDYDMTNENLEQFVNNITFDIENNGELANGNNVTVRAIYSQETAKQLKVVLKDETQTFEVAGLTVKYQSAKDIDQEIYQEAYDKAIEESKETSYFSDETVKTFYKAYYVVEDLDTITSQNNYLVFVFSEIYQDYDWSTHQDIEKTRYLCYYTSIDSSYNSEETYMYKAYLYDDAYEYISDQSQILLGIQRLSLIYNTESKIEEVNISANQI